MEKAFAYVCAAPDAAPRLLKRYCRKIYELGYVPICPKLSDSQYLQMENADEKREFQNISRQKLCRCRMLVVCGNEISTPCPLKSVQPKSEILSVRRWKVWQKSRNQMNMTGSDSSVVFSQPVTGFASIAFGYPNAFWGEPQTPGIQPPIEYRKR